jgi:lipoprotein-anchoring transpeptidase ErfK/SrfK
MLSERARLRKGRFKMKQAIVALAAAILVSTPALASDSAAAVETAASALQANKFVWSDPASAEPVTIVVSIPQQRAFVYRGDALVAASAVSTGRIGNDTPTGVYPILQKNEKHRSNLYDDAPMPYMQRLTWDGIALHAGKNPGFPDSHGCVRLPMEFARKLFAITQKGTTVVVTDMEVEGATLDRELLVTETARANSSQMALLDR